VALIVGGTVDIHSKYLTIAGVDVDVLHARSRVCAMQISGILPAKRDTAVSGFLECDVLFRYKDVDTTFILLKGAPLVVSPVVVV
jgi:hypothetical protein